MRSSFKFAWNNSAAMTDQTMTLEEALHWEPIAELALQRYSLDINNDSVELASMDNESVKDVHFVVVGSCAVEQSAQTHHQAPESTMRSRGPGNFFDILIVI